MLDSIYKKIQEELRSAIEDEIEVIPGKMFNQFQYIELLMAFDQQFYEYSRDSQGKLKYWFDIIGPRVDDEIKSIRFDTANIKIIAPFSLDATGAFILSSKLRERFRDTEEGTNLQDAREEFSGFGNVLWRETWNNYEMCDMRNTFLTNQRARYISSPDRIKKGKHTPGVPQTAVLHRHEYYQSDIEEYRGIWNKDAIKNVIEYCAVHVKKESPETADEQSSIPVYELVERNGLIPVSTLKEVNGGTPTSTDEYKSVPARIVIPRNAGINNTKEENYILYARKIPKMPYEETHRGRYKKTWWREGMISTLLHPQVRANEIGNQIARSLEWSGHITFKSSDAKTFKNIMTDMQRGDIIKSKDIEQLNVKPVGIDLLFIDWNRNIAEADRLAKSTELTRGESMKSGTPLGLGRMLDVRASEYHENLRKKFSLGYRPVIQNWILPNVAEELTPDSVAQLTGDLEYMDQYYKYAVNGWFLRNREAFGPITKEQEIELKEKKVTELKKNPTASVRLMNEVWEDILNRLVVVIMGENMDIRGQLNNSSLLIGLEADPVRRTALIEKVYTLVGEDISHLPKSDPANIQPVPAPAPANAPAPALPEGDPNQITT